MNARSRLSDAIVLALIVLMWTGLLMAAAYFTFQWMVESFGREVALVTVFAMGGVVLAIGLWVGSSRHTTAIWRSALSYAADTEQMTVDALRSLSAVQREDARTHRIREQGRTQIEVSNYRAALSDARQEIRREWQQTTRAQPAQPSWAMLDDDASDGAIRRIE
jgi:hypothetical protein